MIYKHSFPAPLPENTLLFLNLPNEVQRIVVMQAGTLLEQGPDDMTFEDALDVIMALTNGGWFGVH